MRLLLPDRLHSQITAEARAAFPNECCGLIEGERTGASVRVVALHPTANLADDPAAGFEIDPSAHIRLRCALRGTSTAVVGCYHSHPNGRAGPSARDRESGCEEGFIWVITAADVLAAFEGPGFRPVPIAGSP